ncbi:MAG: class I SAM-dependent methyltransferase, partial [Planctomycetota bacterium JB042]
MADREPAGMHDHYADAEEARRLDAGAGRLEWMRTWAVLERHLPEPPATVLDVGGGPGRYSVELASRGHAVRLLDPVERHVEEAARRLAAIRTAPSATAEVGDARALPAADGSTDVVLLLGPLYHLQERNDRLAALAEARRVLRPGGVVAAAAISRFASLMDGLRKGLIDDPEFRSIVDGDLEHGRHVNPTGHPRYFTTAYFHRPDELREEVAAAGFAIADLVSLEGPAWMADDLDRWLVDDAMRERLLGWLARVESEPALLGAGAHLLA